MDHNAALLSLIAELRMGMTELTEQRDAALARVAELESGIAEPDPNGTQSHHTSVRISSHE